MLWALQCLWLWSQSSGTAWHRRHDAKGDVHLHPEAKRQSSRLYCSCKCDTVSSQNISLFFVSQVVIILQSALHCQVTASSACSLLWVNERGCTHSLRRVQITVLESRRKVRSTAGVVEAMHRLATHARSCQKMTTKWKHILRTSVKTSVCLIDPARFLILWLSLFVCCCCMAGAAVCRRPSRSAIDRAFARGRHC